MPAFYTEQMILDLIMSKNIQRRQLSAGHRGLLAGDYQEFYAAAAKAAQADAARQTAAKLNAQVTGSTLPADRR